MRRPYDAWERSLLWCVVALILAAAAGCSESLANIVGESMAPTLKNGEKVLITHAFTEIDRGDIVAFRYPNDESKNFLQRIVGVPGDRVESVQGRVLIDGRVLTEPYVLDTNRSADSWGPVTIPEGQYFVMGDNRHNSSDSRSWGLVRRNSIWAKVLRR